MSSPHDEDHIFGGNQQFPGRPSHPDFWKLSELVLQMDAESQGRGIDEMLNEYVDDKSFSYLAVQRAGRFAGTPTDVMMCAASTVQGFVLGVRYAMKYMKEEE